MRINQELISSVTIVLIGVGNYESPGLNDLPSAQDNVGGLKNVLRSSHVGASLKNIHTILEPSGRTSLLKKLKKIAESSETQKILVYYSGHGVLSEEGDLYLTVTTSTIEDIAIDGVKVSELSKSLGNRDSYFIFDSCFSERAFAQIKQHNFVAIASSARNRTTKYPTGSRYSLFTGELIDVIKKGIERAGKTITFNDIYKEIKERLVQKAGEDSKPEIIGGELLDNLIVAQNVFGLSEYVVDLQSMPNEHLIVEEINALLITSSLTNSSAPTKIEDIFVPPPLYNHSKEKLYAFRNVKDDINEEVEYEVSDLLTKNQNFLLYGKKESGKTTLINYLIHKILIDVEYSSMYIPCLIDFKNLNSNNSRPVHKEIRRYLNLRPVELEHLLERKMIYLFVDNYDAQDVKRSIALNQFVQKNRKHKFLLAQNEVFLQETEQDNGNRPEFFATFNSVHIHTFGKKEVFNLAEKWFTNSDRGKEDIDKIKHQLYKTLLFTKIPAIPLNICFLLWVFETSRQVTKVINKASLIEEFVETVLEKFAANTTNGDYGLNIDYRTKQHYLSYLAGDMAEKNKYSYEFEELVTLTTSFFRGKGNERIDIAVFIDYLLIKGILVKRDLDYTFKFKCIAEYFTARNMIENPIFKEYVIDEKRYLSFFNEIDYFTALIRKNNDLLALVENRLDSHHAQAEDFGTIQLSDFVTAYLHPAVIDKNDFFLDFLDEKNLGDFEEESSNVGETISTIDFQESFDSLPIRGNDEQKIAKDFDDLDCNQRFLDSLRLYSTILKNCEFLSLEVKIQALRKCLHYWGKVLVYSISSVEENLSKENFYKFLSSFDDLFEDEEKVEKAKQKVLEKHAEFQEIARVTSPIMIQMYMMESLGTDKLGLGFISDDVMNSVIPVQLLSVFTYADLKLDKFPKYLTDVFTNLPKEDFLIKMFYLKIMSLYMQGMDLKPGDANKLEELIANIHIDHISKSKGKRYRKQHRDQITKQLRKRKRAYKGD